MSKSVGPRKEIPSARRSGAKHVIVDGSNLATEGRSRPSLAQLNDAVLAFLDEHPKTVITVIVDATFGHRIDSKEVASFDKAVEHNELVTPPAGTVGRGDAFVLNIAEKVGAAILSNDSYQEFHGQYPWLFDEGRLIGGKPVPNIGWVFVERVPVRGDKSRRAVRDAKSDSTDEATPVKKSRAKVSAVAMKPMPIPKSLPPGATLRAKVSEKASEGSKSVNEILPFLQFVEQSSVGSVVSGQVESYSSHGAYIALGDVRGYVPLRFLGSPAPRSAREVMTIGEEMSFEVVEIIASRRSINLRPAVAGAGGSVKKATGKKASLKKVAAEKTPVNKAAVKKVPAKKAPAKSATNEKANSKKPAAKKASVKKVAVKKIPVKKAAVKKVPAKRTPVTKAPAKTAAKKEVVKKPTSTSPAKKVGAKKA
jgi:hypothetical protein